MAATTRKISKADVAAALGVSESKLDEVVAAVQQPAAEAKAKPAAKKAAAPKAETIKERADKVLADAGLAYTSGRTYCFTALVEAQARALSAKKPTVEVVQSPKSGANTVAVVVIRDENGVVYSQNLRKA